MAEEMERVTEERTIRRERCGKDREGNGRNKEASEGQC